MSEIKAIETVYRGYRFRSRLEARWAVFFDYMGIAWDYEHEGYQTTTGYYVPDFWLPQVYLRETKKGVIFEVKPPDHPHEHLQLEEVAGHLGVGGILACGFDFVSWKNSDTLVQIAPWWDSCATIYTCSHCHTTKFCYPVGYQLECDHCSKGDYDYSERLLEKANADALRYRFW